MKIKPVTTKVKIKEITLNMLNERGLSNVKMRDVSDAMKISIGNLTYHYPKWENLIDEIFGQFQEDIDKLYDSFPKDISDVVGYIEQIYEIQVRYAFLFSNFYIFFQQFPKYKTIEEEFFISRMVVMRQALEKLIEKGYLYPASSEHNYDLLVKNTWLILSGWYGFSMIFKDTKYAITKEEFFLSIWNMYVFHLTETGREIVIESYNKHFTKQ
jgi:AcrR family transcriptional regulator